MPARRCVTARLVLLAVLGCWTATASATDKAAAREAYRVAIQHFNLGEFNEALTSFKEAYRNFEDPTFLYNIAQCQRQLGLKQEAILSYRAYLRESPQAENRDEVLRLVASLDEALKQEQRSQAQPPGGFMPPNEHGVAPAAVTTGAPPVAHDGARPKKRWWIWVVVGGVVAVAAVGVGVGVALAPKSTSYPSATPSDGTFHF